ncbi:hypothetical protein N9560_00405 [Hyphomicrobiales bacterium]|jgi:hypothetical protein|nr:hypothetical protein [Rhodobiaceae bacterium]MBT6223663.1 hypothetical protein [Rhodobiaceae bacterium]MDB4127897.1 hypothetical protein [Hyphomicrobiales bacterium]|tara:strand:- start:7393 stop:7701 length:309 start_codon:yes stop_codon:yes gene_type:complete
MITSTQKFVVHAWSFLFNHEVSPLRHIPDVAIRHYVLQVLGIMWAVSFSIAIGSYTFMAISIVGHTVLIAAAAITVATWTTASMKPKLFIRSTGQKNDNDDN